MDLAPTKKVCESQLVLFLHNCYFSLIIPWQTALLNRRKIGGLGGDTSEQPDPEGYSQSWALNLNLTAENINSISNLMLLQVNR